MNIPISKTFLKENEIKSVLNPLRSGWIVQGPYTKDFEDQWSKFTNIEHSIAVSSCTAGLELSLAALGIGAGDEIIIPAFTWISTANVIEHLGAKVVFCDINLDTFNIDYKELEKKITSRTKGLIPVHLFGLAVDMDKIKYIQKKFNLFIVEDAACGFGSYFKNKHVGSFGDTGCFSFHPRKAITTGEGGMVTTNNRKLAKKIRNMRDHGASETDLTRHHGPQPYILADHKYAGYNFRMTDIQGILGLYQMKRAQKISEERKKLATVYDNKLKNINWIDTPRFENHFIHGYQSYPCILNKKNINLKNISKFNNKRNDLMKFLFSKGISTRPATHAVHMLSFYKNKYKIKKNDYPNAYIANDVSFSLPLYNGLKIKEINYIVKTINDYASYEHQ